MNWDARTCERCGGIGCDVKRAMLMVEGHAMNEHLFCPSCLREVLQALQGTFSAEGVLIS